MRVHKQNLLNAQQIKHAKPGKLNDGGGLVVETKPDGRQYFHFRVKQNGKQTQVGLGSLKIVTLAAAREMAAKLRIDCYDGMTPKEALGNLKRGNKNVPTFKDIADSYIEDHEKSWGKVHLRQWKQVMRDYVYPQLGDMHFDDIQVEHIVEMFRHNNFWDAMNPTAKKTQTKVAEIFGAARSLQLFTGPSPAAWADNLQYLLPKPSKVHTVTHHPAMEYQELPTFMQRLEVAHKSGRNPPSAKGLYWLILTGTRYNEAAGARFEEIKGNVWTIPASRMKTGNKEFKVPLTPPLLTLLEQLKEERCHELMFPSLTKQGTAIQAMSNNAMTKYLKANQHDKTLTTHGFRATFKNWCLNETEFDDVMTELCLSHVSGDSARKAYARNAALKPRRKIMEAWASYALSRPISTEDGLTLVS